MLMSGFSVSIIVLSLLASMTEQFHDFLRVLVLILLIIISLLQKLYGVIYDAG